MTQKKLRNNRVQVLLTDDEIALLEVKAERKGLPNASYARTLLLEALQQVNQVYVPQS